MGRSSANDRALPVFSPQHPTVRVASTWIDERRGRREARAARRSSSDECRIAAMLVMSRGGTLRHQAHRVKAMQCAIGGLVPCLERRQAKSPADTSGQRIWDGPTLTCACKQSLLPSRQLGKISPVQRLGIVKFLVRKLHCILEVAFAGIGFVAADIHIDFAIGRVLLK